MTVASRISIVELERLGSDFTRDDVIARIAAIKAGTQPQEPAAAQQVEGDLEPSPIKAETIPLDLVAGAVSANDVRFLRRDMVDPAEFDRRLPRPILSESAALVVLAKLSELSVVETRLLPHLGFSRVSHLFTVGNASAIDLIDQHVLLVATRGKVGCAVPEAAISPSEDPVDVATALFGNAQTRFQLFGSSENRRGWEALKWKEG